MLRSLHRIARVVVIVSLPNAAAFAQAHGDGPGAGSISPPCGATTGVDALAITLAP